MPSPSRVIGLIAALAAFHAAPLHAGDPVDAAIGGERWIDATPADGSMGLPGSEREVSLIWSARF